MAIPDDPNFDGIWDYQYCTEKMPQETYFGRDGVNDMFWAEPANKTAIREHCQAKYGVTPRDSWIDVEFNGVKGASNIVFSNGLYDPWSSGGVLKSNGMFFMLHSRPAFVIRFTPSHLKYVITFVFVSPLHTKYRYFPR
jgi:hypothetical protein